MRNSRAVSLFLVRCRQCAINVSSVARGVLERIGSTDSRIGLDASLVGIMESIVEQSAEINQESARDVRAQAAGWVRCAALSSAMNCRGRAIRV